METSHLILSHITHLGRRTWAYLAKGPAYHYAYSQWRLRQLGQWARRVYPMHLPSDVAFLAALDPARPELEPVARAVQNGQIEKAGREIALHFAGRPRPRFHFSLDGRAKSAAAVPEVMKQATIQQADEICQNQFRFRSIPAVQFDGTVDWTFRPEGNVDWTWDLNRHYIFLTLGRAYQYTGDARYPAKFVQLLNHWQSTHPADVRDVVWRPFEAAVRLNTWTWALYLFLGCELFAAQGLLDLLKGVLLHARFLAANLEYHVANNHLLLEAKALAQMGLLFPEFLESGHWRRVGQAVLWREVERQVSQDGVHLEQATLYQRLVASELLEMLLLLKHNEADIPPGVVARFERMADFQAAITRADGSLPLFGDSARSDAHIRFDACWGAAHWLQRPDLFNPASDPGEESVWLMGTSQLPDDGAGPGASRASSTDLAESRCGGSVAFPKGGYVVMQHGRGENQLHLVFDAGPLGYKPAPGHAHADALSFEVFAYGRAFLTDSGGYRYHATKAWRSYFRGSRAHNTVVVDGRDQSEMSGDRHVYRAAQTKLQQWLSTPHFDLVSAAHNGYQRAPSPIVHQRQVLFIKPDYWVVVDALLGSGQHQFDLLFHLMPGTPWRLEGQALHTGHPTGANLSIMLVAAPGLGVETSVIEGAGEPVQGWVSLYSGKKEPAPVLRYRSEGAAPVRLVSLICPQPASWFWLSDPSDQALAWAVSKTADQETMGAGLDYFLIKTSSAPEMFACGPYRSDAELLVVRALPGSQEPRAVLMDNGRELFWEEQLLVSQPRPVSGYCLGWEEGRLVAQEVGLP